LWANHHCRWRTKSKQKGDLVGHVKTQKKVWEPSKQKRKSGKQGKKDLNKLDPKIKCQKGFKKRQNTTAKQAKMFNQALYRNVALT